MPRIPIASSEAIALPGSIGGFKSDSVGQAIGQAGQNIAQSANGFGDLLAKAEKDKTEKEQKTNILAAQNDFIQQSNERYMQETEARSGSGALKDDNSGYKGFYQDGNAFYDKVIPEILKKNNISPEFAGLATEQLNSHANQFRVQNSSYESAQLQTYRKETLANTDQTIMHSLIAEMDIGGGVQSVDKAVSDYAQALDLIQGPGGNKDLKDAELYAFGNRAAHTAVQAMAERDPVAAMASLEDDKLSNYLKPEDIVALKKQVSTQVLPFQTAKAVDELSSSGMSHDLSVEAANTLYKDKPDLLKNVVEGLNHKETDRVAGLNSAALEIENKYVQEFNDRSKPMPVRASLILQIDKDLPDKVQMDERNTILNHYDAEVSARKAIIADKNKKAPGQAEYEQGVRLAKAMTLVYSSPASDPRVVIDWAKKGLIDYRDFKEVQQMIRDKSKDPGEANYLAGAVRQADATFKDKATRELFVQDLQASFKAAATAKKAPLVDDERDKIAERLKNRFIRGEITTKVNGGLFSPDTTSPKIERTDPLASLQSEVNDPKGSYAKKYGAAFVAGAAPYSAPGFPSLVVFKSRDGHYIGVDLKGAEYDLTGAVNPADVGFARARVR